MRLLSPIVRSLPVLTHLFIAASGSEPPRDRGHWTTSKAPSAAAVQSHHNSLGSHYALVDRLRELSPMRLDRGAQGVHLDLCHVQCLRSLAKANLSQAFRRPRPAGPRPHHRTRDRLVRRRDDHVRMNRGLGATRHGGVGRASPRTTRRWRAAGGERTRSCPSARRCRPIVGDRGSRGRAATAASTASASARRSTARFASRSVFVDDAQVSPCRASARRRRPQMVILDEWAWSGRAAVARRTHLTSTRFHGSLL